jgi:hypothetical protein
LNLIDPDELTSIQILVKSIVKHFEGFNRSGPIQQNTSNQQSNFTFRYAQTLLTLTKWLSSKTSILKDLNSLYVSQKMNNNSNFILPTSTTIEEISYNLDKLLSAKHNAFSSQFVENEAPKNYEIIIGDLLDLATSISPNLAKTWFSYADWCYKFGKKNFDVISFNNSTAKIEVEDENILTSLNNLSVQTSNDEKDYIKSLLGEKSLNNIHDEVTVIEMIDLIANNCRSLSIEDIHDVVNEWKKIIKRVNYFYRLACKSYFTYLKLNQTVIIFENYIFVSEFFLNFNLFLRTIIFHTKKATYQPH